MSQPPSGSEPLRSNVVPYGDGEVHSTPEVMADISATPSSEKMTHLTTDYSGDPVTLDVSGEGGGAGRSGVLWVGSGWQGCSGQGGGAELREIFSNTKQL